MERSVLVFGEMQDTQKPLPKLSDGRDVPFCFQLPDLSFTALIQIIWRIFAFPVPVHYLATLFFWCFCIKLLTNR
jgi:hypothetical protein